MSDNDTIDFDCSHCEQRLRVPASAAGKRISCPECNKEIAVPGATGITEEAPAPTGKRPERYATPYEDRERERSRSYDEDEPFDMPVRRRVSGGGGVIAAAVCMLLVAMIGFGFNVLGCVLAIAGPEQRVDANAPDFVQELQKFGAQSRGPLAASMQGTFALLSVISILGSIQMIRHKSWGLGLTASIVSMINIGNCCCVLGLPVGVWALIVLVNPEVRETFS